MKYAWGRHGWCFDPPRKQNSRLLPLAYRLFESIRDQLLERAKELCIVDAPGVVSHNPRSIDEPSKQMPIEQRLHILLKPLAELSPIALVLGVDKQRRKEIHVLDVELAAASSEQIATAAFERESTSLDETMLPVLRPLPPLKIAVELSSCVVDDETLPPLVPSTITDCCFKVPEGIAPERIRPEVEPYSEERGASSV